MSREPVDGRDDLEKSYAESLTSIVEYAQVFPEIWSQDTKIEVINAFIESDESFQVYLERRNGTYGFSAEGEKFFLDANGTATYLRNMGGKFYPEQWKETTYKAINQRAGPMLVNRELEKRKKS